MKQRNKPSAPSDPDALKAAVKEDWTTKSVAWNRWADVMAELAERLNDPLLDAAEVAPGETVLDLASGIGEPALSCARRVGEAGRVTATDLVPEMLAGARRRATEAGLANVDFEIADMEALPFDAAAFDRVICRFGLMFCPRPERAVAEARRVLKPAGRAAFMVWGPIEDNTMFDVVKRIVDGYIDRPMFVGDLTPFRFGAGGKLASVMSAAGFKSVKERGVQFTPGPPAGSRFWRYYLDMSCGAALEAMSPERRAEIDAALERAFDDYLDGDAYRLVAHVRIGVGAN